MRIIPSYIQDTEGTRQDSEGARAGTSPANGMIRISPSPYQANP